MRDGVDVDGVAEDRDVAARLSLLGLCAEGGGELGTRELGVLAEGLLAAVRVDEREQRA